MQEENNVNIRLIKLDDNIAIKNIIRSTLKEYGADKPNTAYTDYDTKHMFEAYQSDKSFYFVAELNGKIVGGAGLQALANNPNEICELQKLYILPEGRGFRIGIALVEKVLETAKEQEYKQCYIESFDNMHAAISLYEKFGFKTIDYSMGNTGHSACNVWMLKNI
ncbi:MAG: GNAT family N-acetyltransferase [Bacteroidales bacterium]|nr:GNAT family N-acetyltransferase [Bacteroidales bacterium]